MNDYATVAQMWCIGDEGGKCLAFPYGKCTSSRMKIYHQYAQNSMAKLMACDHNVQTIIT
jgi:hypothetical protein